MDTLGAQIVTTLLLALTQWIARSDFASAPRAIMASIYSSAVTQPWQRASQRFQRLAPAGR
jgi:hypothetical protein